MRPLTWLRIQGDRALAVTLVLAGAIAVVIGWAQASDALVVTQQIPYLISGGLFGLVLVGVGIALWLSADLRDEWRGIARIEDELRAIRLQGEGSTATAPQVDLTSAPVVQGKEAVRKERRTTGALQA